MYAFNNIRTVHLELTSRCNAACPMCPRNIEGGVVNPGLPLSELTLDEIKKIFPHNFLHQLDVMYLCGNYGDPIIARDLHPIAEYFRTYSKLRLGMHTNGSAHKPAWWSQLAAIMKGGPHYVRFGIDGLAETNHLYRRGTRWPMIMANAQAYIDAGGRAEWDFIVFKHNQHEVEAARQVAFDMGFTKFHVRKSGRFRSEDTLATVPKVAVRNRQGNLDYWIEEPTNEEYLNPAFEALPELRARFESYESYLDQTPISCKAANGYKIYISAEGLAFPCCWLGGIYSAKRSIEQQQFSTMIESAGGLEKLNAKKHGIKEIVEGSLFQKLIPESWNKSSIANGKLTTCARACGADFDPLAVQRDNSKQIKNSSEKNPDLVLIE